MRNYLVKTCFRFLISASLLFGMSACTIKPPDDSSELGAEVSVKDIANAKADAQAGYSFDQAFRVNDSGTVQISDHVFGNSAVRYTYDYLVTSINSTGVFFTESTRETGQVQKGLVTPASWASSQTMSSSRALKFIASLPDPIANLISGPFFSLAHLFSAVKIEPSQALGENERQTTKVTQNSPVNIVGKKLNQNITALLGRGLSSAGMKTLDGVDPTPTPTATATPTPSPAGSATPTPTSSPDAAVDHSGEPCYDPTAHCYGLHVFKHSLVTQNCAQIPDCQVKATHIDFNEIKKMTVSGPDGVPTLQDVRFHWSYEISIEVPGLLVYMDQCYSTLVNQNGQQIPLTECGTVGDFAFGSGH